MTITLDQVDALEERARVLEEETRLASLGLRDAEASGSADQVRAAREALTAARKAEADYLSGRK